MINPKLPEKHRDYSKDSATDTCTCPLTPLTCTPTPLRIGDYSATNAVRSRGERCQGVGTRCKWYAVCHGF